MTITVHLIDAAGTDHTVEGSSGESLMRAATSAGVDGIAADCGGCMTCATCHVIVYPAWAAKLPPASEEEDYMLDTTAVPREATSRLSCQITLYPPLDGLTARLPERQY